MRSMSTGGAIHTGYMSYLYYVFFDEVLNVYDYARYLYILGKVY